MKNGSTAIVKVTRDLLKQGDSYTVAKDLMRRFVVGAAGPHSAALKKMIDGLEEYCEAHAAEYDAAVGADHYCSVPIAEIARALIDLLSGPGKFDGGTLERAIVNICKKGGVDLEGY